MYDWAAMGMMPQSGGFLDQPDWYYVLVPAVKRHLGSIDRARADAAEAKLAKVRGKAGIGV